MHLLVAVEASAEGHAEFKEWIQRKEYKYKHNGETVIHHVFPRQIQLYDLVMQEAVSGQVIADLNTHRNKREPKFKRLLNSLLKLTPITPSPEVQASGARMPKNWLKTLIIGSLPDEKNEEGLDKC